MANAKAGGLFVKRSAAPVPLTGVMIDVRGIGAAATVTVRQRFVNTETKPIEAVYTFPLEEGSAVTELIVETGGRKLVGKIEEREKAFEQYDEALAAGHGAFLADQDRPNIFTVSVGNLLPGQEATVILTYVTELEQHADTVRLMLPTSISPRYVPAEMAATGEAAELDRINPPTVLGSVPYGLRLTVEYTAPHGVKSVSCPSHPAQVEIDGEIVRAELMGQNIQLDRDFVLNITLQEPFVAGAVVTRDNGSDRAVMINLFPELNSYQREPSEFIFLLDRSGSMQGESIRQALNALEIALRSMEEGDRFNIVGFGSRFEKMFSESQCYSQQSLDEATALLTGWTADLGGTELLAPLTDVLESRRGELTRQIMILTDGQVGNEADCIAKAAEHAAHVRIFTFGIGHGASEYLLKGLARAGQGKAELIHPNERIEPKVMRQFVRAAAPSLKNVRIDWGGLQTDLVTPRQIPTFFGGDRLTIYARVTGTTGSSNTEVAVVADGPQGVLRFPVTVDLERPTSFPAVPVLMARNAIRELEEGRGEVEMGSNQKDRGKKSVDRKVLEIALRYQVVSSQTSFVAVEERVAGTQSERAELRRVPIALTTGWGGVMETQVTIYRVAAGAHVLGGEPTFALNTAFLHTSREPEYYRRAPDRVVAGPISTDSLVLLLRCQRADGSFQFDDQALTGMGIAPEMLAAAARALSDTPVAMRVVHTALALALLAMRFADRRDEWQPVAGKAERWLAKQSHSPTGAADWPAWAAAQLALNTR